MKLDPNEPAYPGENDYDDRGRFVDGLTVRQAMAKDNMASLLVGNWEPKLDYCAELAVKAADALIAELNKEQGE